VRPVEGRVGSADPAGAWHTTCEVRERFEEGRAPFHDAGRETVREQTWQDGGPGPGGLFLDVLEDERARAERYNHYFSIVLLRGDKMETAELLRNVTTHVRGSDVVGMVLPGGEYVRERGRGGRLRLPIDWVGLYGAVGILFPETDREGAKVALKRITSLLSSDQEVRVGYAVYPEDSTDASELLSLASD
jgi:hypothetical protein